MQASSLHLKVWDDARLSVVSTAARLSSDAGGVLLRETDRRIGLTKRLAKCFVDHRNPNSIEHSVKDQVTQRMLGIGLGWEDLNDHKALRCDALVALLVDKNDLTGEKRVRERDRGYALASPSTLNRMELGDPDKAANDRYKRIVARPEALDALLLDLFVEAHDEAPREIRLDVDATDDPLHGEQEGRFFHGYYRHYCYLPLYVFCGEHLLVARLRTANIDGSAGSIEELERVVGHIRRHWPTTRINIRGDGDFCREPLMAWCEKNGIGYVFGLPRNKRLESMLDAAMTAAQAEHRRSREPARRFRDFTYRTQDTWSRARRVVGKAEYLSAGPNPRFVVTNLPRRKVRARALYEEIYCARGDMENRIKEQQLDLFADRTSTHVMRANQLRLYFSSFAYVLMQALRRLGAHGTELARAQCGTLRLKLLKTAARVYISTRRVRLAFSETSPWSTVFVQVLENLQRQPLWNDTG